MVDSTPKRIRDRNDKFQLLARLHRRGTYSCQRKTFYPLYRVMDIWAEDHQPLPQPPVTPNLDSGLGDVKRQESFLHNP